MSCLIENDKLQSVGKNSIGKGKEKSSVVKEAKDQANAADRPITGDSGYGSTSSQYIHPDDRSYGHLLGMYKGGFRPLDDARAIGPEAVVAEWDRIWAQGREYAEWACIHETIGKWKRANNPMDFEWLEVLDAMAKRWGRPRVSPEGYVPARLKVLRKRTREDEFADAAAEGAEMVDGERPKRQRKENVRLADL